MSKQKRIKRLERECQDLTVRILSDYGNTGFLRTAKNVTLDDVRGSHLWELWYGQVENGYAVVDIESQIAAAKGDLAKLKQTRKLLIRLLKSLKKEFNIYKNITKGDM